MGIWTFVKSAGKSVFGPSESAPNSDELSTEMNALGFATGDLDISVNGDTVEVSGTTSSQEMKEKVIVALGNIEGIATVHENIAGSDPILYEVQKGETLWGITNDTLGNGNRYMEVYDANKPMLSHPDKIYPGQSLRIPQSAAA